MEAFKKNLFPVGKSKYVHGDRPKVKCILCAILKDDKKIVNLTVYETDLTSISLNLYPYTPGHLIIFPKRHTVDISTITDKEWKDMIFCIKKSISTLRKIYKPKGFNIGMNMGHPAGASIRHIHWHIIPRYKNELGFIDILTGSKIYIEHPKDTLWKVTKAFKDTDSLKKQNNLIKLGSIN